MAKAMQMMISVGGRVTGSLDQTFRRATGNIDDLRARSREAQRELNRLEREFRQGRLTQEQYAAATERITREMRQLENAQRRIKAISGTLQNGFNTAKAVASIAAVGTATTAVGVAMSSLNTAANFQKQMSKVSAVSGAVGADFDELNSKAMTLSESSIFTATQVAEGMEYLALSGMKTKEILGSTEGLLNLAAAAGMDLGVAADITTDIMSAFGMSADQAGHAADIFAFAQANANTNVEQMGEAMKYAAPMANQYGWSIEETSAAMMKLADNGLKGSIAGQAFSSSLGRLANPKVTAAAKKLGMEFFNVKGQMKSLPDVIKEIEKGTAGMTDQQRVSSLGNLFGQEAFKHWAILLESGSDILSKHTKSLEKADGAAKAMSDTMVNNYAGSLNLLKSKIESAQIKFMSPVLPVFQGFFDGIANNIGDNMSTIERAGEGTAKVLKAVLEPFAMNKPELTTAISMDPDALANYEKELAKFNEYGKMDFSDKILASLDTVTTAAEEWLGGSGGEAMGRIFTELGEIAVTAWLGALKGAAGATVDNVMEGNFAAAAATGGAAWLLGGGLMVKGAIGAGKWGKDIYNSRRATATPPISPVTAPATATTSQSQVPNRPAVATSPAIQTVSPTTNRPVYGQNAARILTNATPPANVPPQALATNTAPSASRGSRFLGGAGKIMSKAMLPLAVAGEVVNIARSEDKVKATAEAGGGLAGSLGGAKVGAMIGTMIAPGIGTAIGSAIGGIGGYIGGKFLGGKATDAVRGNDKATAQAPNATQQSAPVTNEAFNTSMTASTTAFTQLATSTTTLGTTMTASMTELDTQTKLVTQNMGTLVQWTGQASGWIATLNGIQPAGQRVIDALNNLEQRINTINLPGSGGGGRTAYE